MRHRGNGDTPSGVDAAQPDPAEPTAIRSDQARPTPQALSAAISSRIVRRRRSMPLRARSREPEPSTRLPGQREHECESRRARLAACPRQSRTRGARSERVARTTRPAGSRHERGRAERRLAIARRLRDWTRMRSSRRPGRRDRMRGVALAQNRRPGAMEASASESSAPKRPDRESGRREMRGFRRQPGRGEVCRIGLVPMSRRCADVPGTRFRRLEGSPKLGRATAWAR